MVDCNRAISIKPDYEVALNNRGHVLQKLGRFDEALADYNKVLSLKPDCEVALNNRGNVLQELGRFDEALVDLDRAISIKPDYEVALNNRGNVLQALRRFDDALDDYEKAISHNPDYADAQWNKGLQLLLLGEFSEGWKLYEWRWKRGSFKFSKRKFEQPLWLGKENLRGKTILLHWEQGLGDTIQFSRYAKEVSKLGCRVLLEVQERLFELMKDIEGVDELILSGSDIPRLIFTYL